MKIQRALISVSDKTNLLEFVRELVSMDIEIISTGGTKKYLEKENIKVRDISDFTGFPEIMNGRVKTLHPCVHGGLLAKRDNPEHTKAVKENNIEYIDMVVVNLYPFAETVAKKDVMHEEIIENIDIGGPSMLRSAAKNYEDVTVITDINDYDVVISELKESGDIPTDLKMMLAYKVFEKTANYDSMICDYFKKKINVEEKLLTNNLSLNLTKNFDLRYGENPHQHAAFYKEPGSKTLWKQIHGKELSYNNILDLEAALTMATDFEDLTCVIVKHNNPCGIGSANAAKEAYNKALKCDPVSAFGGIVAMNKTIDKETAKEVIKTFTECIIAPSFTDDAIEILQTKKNLRILTITIDKNLEPEIEYKKAFGGFLVQEKDKQIYEYLTCVTEKEPTEGQLQDLKFAWIVSKSVKSNAIVIVKDRQTLGIGAGQMSRIDATEIATSKAAKEKLDITDAVLASDAFFPFADSIEKIAPLGIKAVIQPGGSVRDEEVIEACNKHGITMLFTGQRHFKH